MRLFVPVFVLPFMLILLNLQTWDPIKTNYEVPEPEATATARTQASPPKNYEELLNDWLAR